MVLKGVVPGVSGNHGSSDMLVIADLVTEQAYILDLDTNTCEKLPIPITPVACIPGKFTFSSSHYFDMYNVECL